VGRTGSGKTLLLNALCGRALLHGGSVRVETAEAAKDPRDLAGRRIGGVAYVSPEFQYDWVIEHRAFHPGAFRQEGQGGRPHVGFVERSASSCGGRNGHLSSRITPYGREK